MIAPVDVIDLNADVGEMAPDLDAAILEAVTSVNIACGGHAGDAESMRRVAGDAADRGVRIGAHPSYVDAEGFGRTRQDVHPDVLAQQILDQVLELAEHSPAAPQYVKPHGALYHAAATDKPVAEALLQAVEQAAAQIGQPLAVMGQHGALYLSLAMESQIGTILEAFADRAYTADGRLVPRSEPDAVLHDESAVVQQVAGLARGQVRAIDGQIIAVRAQSVCVHSDTPGSAALAQLIRRHLQASGIAVRA